MEYFKQVNVKLYLHYYVVVSYLYVCFIHIISVNTQKQVLFYRTQVTRFKKPNGKEIQSVCWFPTQIATLHQIPSFQSVVIMNVPNTLPSCDNNESYNKVQQVSFWRLESKSFTKYGKYSG